MSAILSLQLQNFVLCGRDKLAHMTQNFATLGGKLWMAELILVGPWFMDKTDPIR